MSFMLTRMFAYFTMAMYLVVGTVAVRVFMPEMTTLSVSTSYSRFFSPTEFHVLPSEDLEVPEMAFSEIRFPVEKKIITAKVLPVIQPKKEVMKVEVVSKNELPFKEPVKILPVKMLTTLENNLVALHINFKYEDKRLALETDEVSTSLAATAEPEFFDYSEEKPVREAPKKDEAIQASEKAEVAADETIQEDLYAATEEVQVDELIAFDYSKAQEDIKTQNLPTVSKVTTQNFTSAGGNSAGSALQDIVPKIQDSTPSKPKSKPVTSQADALQAPIEQEVDTQTRSENALTYDSQVTIQVSGTDLSKTKSEVGFEVRFQDDLNDVVQDYNSGEIKLSETLSVSKMTRSMVVLKRGFAPTNTDLILEAGSAEMTFPLIEEGTFNELLAPYESRGPIGAVLVELDENTEGASIDVPYSKVLRLDENMKVTSSETFSYQLFVGVRAGNALLSYKDDKGVIVSRIIHVHERETTFDANLVEAVKNERVTILEESLLGTDKAPLIITSEEVKQFATSKTLSKINNQTFRTDFGKTLLGARKYLELGHQSEPVFVGFKDTTTLDVPSESFMRFVLSKFDSSQLANRCVVQVNLAKSAVKVDVGAESVGSNLMTSTQILDADGKFYDSVSEKSRKVIVVGENQGPAEGQDGKVNLKISYQDGSSEFLGTYCSPNTYLVEQL